VSSATLDFLMIAAVYGLPASVLLAIVFFILACRAVSRRRSKSPWGLFVIMFGVLLAGSAVVSVGATYALGHLVTSLPSGGAAGAVVAVWFAAGLAIGITSTSTLMLVSAWRGWWPR
jgi:hypothetical protein